MSTFPVDHVFRSLPQGSYAAPEACQRDVTNCVNVFPTLYPEVAVLQGGQGSQIVVKGTIPIDYNNVVYHFPIEIQLPAYYPTESPSVRVVASSSSNDSNNSSLRIVPGHRHVDAEGRVYLQYISNWSVGESTLAEMVMLLSQEFSRAPPLYSPSTGSRSATTTSPPPPAYASQQPPPPPPPVYRAPPNVPPPPVYRAPATSSSSSSSSAAASSSAHSKLFRARCVDKIKFRLETALPKLQSDFQQELQRSEQLEDNAAGLAAQLAQLCAVERQMEAQLVELSQAHAVLDQRVQEQHRQREDTPVDQLVGFPFDPQAQNAFACVTDSLAIEDTLYQVNRKLQRREIDLKLFLKLTRSLAREQFFKSALAIKLHHQQQQQPARV